MSSTMYNYATQTMVVQETFNIILKKLHDILASKLYLQNKILGEYLSLVSGQRWYVSHDEGSMSRLWDQIRAKPEMTDFVIEITRELMLKSLDILGTVAFVNYMAEALSDAQEYFAEEESVADTDTLKQMNPDGIDDPDTKTESRLKANPWFMVMEITPMCGIIETIYKHNLAIEQAQSTRKNNPRIEKNE